MLKSVASFAVGNIILWPVNKLAAVPIYKFVFSLTYLMF